MQAGEETANSPSQHSWTLDTLYFHLSSMIAASEKRSEEHILSAEKSALALHASTEKAITKAETATDKRFDNANGFRDAMADQSSTFVSRVEVDQRIGAVADKTADIALRVTRMESKGIGLNAGWGYLVGGLSAVAVVIGLIVSLIRSVKP